MSSRRRDEVRSIAADDRPAHPLAGPASHQAGLAQPAATEENSITGEPPDLTAARGRPQPPVWCPRPAERADRSGSIRRDLRRMVGRRKDRPIADLLADRGWISAEDRPCSSNCSSASSRSTTATPTRAWSPPRRPIRTCWPPSRACRTKTSATKPRRRLVSSGLRARSISLPDRPTLREAQNPLHPDHLACQGRDRPGLAGPRQRDGSRDRPEGAASGTVRRRRRSFSDSSRRPGSPAGSTIPGSSRFTSWLVAKRVGTAAVPITPCVSSGAGRSRRRSPTIIATRRGTARRIRPAGADPGVRRGREHGGVRPQPGGDPSRSEGVEHHPG